MVTNEHLKQNTQNEIYQTIECQLKPERSGLYQENNDIYCYNVVVCSSPAHIPKSVGGDLDNLLNLVLIY